MRSAYCIGLAFWIATAGAAAHAAELELEGNKLTVVGMLDGSALTTFVEQINSGRVRTVVFENSLGGTAEVAEAYAQAIRDKGLLTEARGQCQAACAYAFLAGKEHRFGRGLQLNALVIPLAKRPTTAELQAGRWRGDEPQRASADAVSVSTTGATAVSPESATPAPSMEPWPPGQGVVFTSTPTLFGRVYNTYWCDGSQGTDFSRCDRLSNADPYQLGVLTPSGAR
ncbi:hypothetical protein ACSFA8_17320 [Variovorax sp. RT4R15]|uniref:hypothetical protein n=1 Tax=Variovorax sp. RT4R15 TaxID=3443737 RepID=UPI003F47E7E6